MTAGRIAAIGADRDRVRLAAAIVVASSAWALTAALEASGMAGALHHDALLEGGPPMSIAIGLFTASWAVMLAAMMVPASLPVIARSASVAWSAAFVLVWMVVGLVGLAADGLLHRTVDASPWLAQHAALIGAASLAGAGLFQFTAVKRRALDRCRVAGHGPVAVHWDPAVLERSASTASFVAGWRHGVDCLGSAGALMLLLFAEGVASLVPMALLTILMAYEANGRHGVTASRVAGLALVLLAVYTVA
jgi:predicted metal-binding membrane protein